MDINRCLKESHSYDVQTELWIFAFSSPKVHLPQTSLFHGTTIQSVAQAKNEELIFDSSLSLIPPPHPLQPSIHLEVLLALPLKQCL